MDKSEWEEELRQDAYDDRAREIEEAKREYELRTDIDVFIKFYEDRHKELSIILNEMNDLYKMYGHEFDPREWL